MGRDKALFGPAGNCEAFYAAGNKRTVQMFPWLQAQYSMVCVTEASHLLVADSKVQHVNGLAKSKRIYLRFVNCFIIMDS
jgi:hypothetical protein